MGETLLDFACPFEPRTMVRVYIMNQAQRPISTGMQFISLALGSAAVAFGLFASYGAAFPGPCGDNPGPSLGVIEAWLLDVPLGLLVLGVGVFVRRGSPKLRRICFAMGPVILCLPPLAGYFFGRWHCP